MEDRGRSNYSMYWLSLKFHDSVVETAFLGIEAGKLARHLHRCCIFYFVATFTVLILDFTEVIEWYSTDLPRVVLLAQLAVCFTLASLTASQRIFHTLGGVRVYEALGTLVAFLAMVALVLLAPQYRLKILEGEIHQNCSRDSDAALLLCLLCIVVAAHLILPLRWVVLVPLQIAPVLIYATCVFAWGSPEPAPEFNLACLICAVLISSIGKRSTELSLRETFAVVSMEHQGRLEAERASDEDEDNHSVEADPECTYRAGDKVEVWSNSLSAWCCGHIHAVTGGMVHVEFMTRDGQNLTKKLPYFAEEIRRLPTSSTSVPSQSEGSGGWDRVSLGSSCRASHPITAIPEDGDSSSAASNFKQSSIMVTTSAQTDNPRDQEHGVWARGRSDDSVVVQAWARERSGENLKSSRFRRSLISSLEALEIGHRLSQEDPVVNERSTSDWPERGTGESTESLKLRNLEGPLDSQRSHMRSLDQKSVNSSQSSWPSKSTSNRPGSSQSSWLSNSTSNRPSVLGLSSSSETASTRSFLSGWSGLTDLTGVSYFRAATHERSKSHIEVATKETQTLCVVATKETQTLCVPVQDDTVRLQRLQKKPPLPASKTVSTSGHSDDALSGAAKPVAGAESSSRIMASSLSATELRNCYSSLEFCLKRWNLSYDRSACCPFHVAVKVCSIATKKLERQRCNPLWSPFLGWSCDVCACVNKVEEASCPMCTQGKVAGSSTDPVLPERTFLEAIHPILGTDDGQSLEFSFDAMTYEVLHCSPAFSVILPSFTLGSDCFALLDQEFVRELQSSTQDCLRTEHAGDATSELFEKEFHCDIVLNPSPPSFLPMRCHAQCILSMLDMGASRDNDDEAEILARVVLTDVRPHVSSGFHHAKPFCLLELANTMRI